jgi:hypothetical protein
VPDQPLEIRLKLVVLLAVRTALQVELKLEDLRRVQLSIDEAIELVGEVLTVHRTSFLSRLRHRTSFAVAADDT